MPETYEYLVSGRGCDGRKVAALLRAESGDAAVREFEAEGNTEVRLHTDDVLAPLMKHYALSKFFTPMQQVDLPTIGPLRRYFLFVLIGYRQSWLVVLLALVVLALTWFMGGTMFYLIETLAVVLLFFPFLINLFFMKFGSGAKYVQLLNAIGYGQWKKALRLIPEIKLQLAPNELPTLKAQALAGLGHLEEALITIDELADNPELPRYLYWMAQSVIYQESGEPEKVLGAMAQAHELAPRMNLLMIAYAINLLLVRRDLRQARDLIVRARRQAIAESSLPYLHHAEGLLAHCEGRNAEAVEAFATAVRLYEPYVRWNRSLLPVEARMRSRYCLALAASGDTAAARQQFRMARPILKAHREDDVLRQCEEAIG